MTTYPSVPQWEELSLAQAPDAKQLDNIKSHLDLVLLALEALTAIGSEAMLKAARDLGLESVYG
ncbi:MAG: DUF3038 domain-containing protein, partial [Spirulinaceae cyanobacterium]